MPWSPPLALQDNVEPLLLLANKYEVKAPLSLCTNFLSKHFTTAKYTSLPQAQLARLPGWLTIARRLQMSDELHTSILACLEDNLTKLSSASMTIISDKACLACQSSGRSTKYLTSAGKCTYCGKEDPLAGPAAATLAVFQSIWGVTAVRGSTTSTQAIKAQLAALQQYLAPQETMQLLMALVAKATKAAGLAPVTIFQSIWRVIADHIRRPSTQATSKELLAALQQSLDPQEAMQLLMALVAKDYKGP